MKNIFLIAVATIVSCYIARACDMCGGGTSNQYIGLLPAMQRNFTGVQYLRREMSATFPSAYKGRPDVHTRDVFQTMQLWGRYRIGHYQVFAFLPYVYASRSSTESGNITNNGIGDATLLLNRVFVQKESGKNAHTVFGGVGLKLPTGKYTSVMYTENAQAMSPGTGACNVVANANYTFQRKDRGINADANGMLTTVSPGGYRYGSSMSAGVSAFHVYKIKEVRILPQVGARYEYAWHDEYDHHKGWVNTYSGGTTLFASAGAQMVYNKHGIRMSCLLPVYTDAGSETHTNYRVETSYFILL